MRLNALLQTCLCLAVVGCTSPPKDPGAHESSIGDQPTGDTDTAQPTEETEPPADDVDDTAAETPADTPADTAEGDSTPTVEAAPTETLTYDGSDESFRNPERGIHEWMDLNQNRWPDHAYEDGYTLSYAAALLEDFRDGPISDEYLDEMKEGLSLIADSGIKVFIRFKYNNGDGDDAPLEQVLEHIAQLGPVVTEYADVITHLEAGFIGYWGEWHTSTNDLDNDEAKQQILEALMDAVPDDMMVAVRTPMDKEALYGEPLTEDEAFTGTYKARLGHHNDCYLATESDAGTYHYTDIERWKDYVVEDTRFTPRGGDTCSARPEEDRGDCATALAEFESMHWSYLGATESLPHFDEWREAGCFDEIERRMGYRFRLVDAEVPPAVRPGGHFAFGVTLHNDGFAALFNPRPVKLVLAGDGGRYVLELDVDPRRWEAGDDHRVEATLQLPADMVAGDYTLSLALPDRSETLADDPRYAIRFANVDVWEAAEGVNVLGVIGVTDDAPGTVDADASTFGVIDD